MGTGGYPVRGVTGYQEVPNKSGDWVLGWGPGKEWLPGTGVTQIRVGHFTYLVKHTTPIWVPYYQSSVFHQKE